MTSPTLRYLLYIAPTILLLSLSVIPLLAEARHGGFHALEGVPGLGNADNYTTQGFISALYRVSIGAAALLVVLKIIIAGVKYMLSEIVTNKEDAKKEIWSAILGLLIILVAVTLLNTINPQLTNLNALKNAPAAKSSLKGGSQQETELKLKAGYSVDTEVGGGW